jgi:hypothetical protein
MNPEQQRIEIAKACGEGHHHLRNLPDYLNDLNAMHEAEKVLTEKQRMNYSDYTYDIACESQKQTGKWTWISLTAAQRAEAFLRTLNLWEE